MGTTTSSARKTRRSTLLACASLAAVLLVVPARAAPGDLDPTFGVGGKVTTDFASRSDFALGVAIQPDGKIVAAGHSADGTGFDNVNFALARYGLDGSLDAGFGSGGKVTTDFGGGFDAAAAVAVQADARIVAVGSGVIVATGRTGFALARYNPDGSLDTTFGGDGRVTIDFGIAFRPVTSGNAVAIQADGKIVAAGSAGTAGENDFALARFNSDGSLDTSFGSGGKVLTPFGGYEFAFELAIQADGKIVAAGHTDRFGEDGFDFALARYNPDGSLDAGFGSGGKVTTHFGSTFFEAAYGVAIQADGKIVAAGTGAGDFALARYNPNGSLDTNFGLGGKVTTDIGGSGNANADAAQADGRITAVGSTSAGDFTLVQYRPDGSLDGSFGNGGTVTTDFSATDNAFDVAIQGDGKIVAAGGTIGTGFSDFALARYENGGALVVSIDIKPGGGVNPIKLSSRGVVPVAVLSTESFDATTVSPSTVCFGDDNPSERDCTEAHGRGHLEDVNGDGKTDLVLHYEIAETGIDAGDQTACLSATTFVGASIEGCDSIEPH